MPENLDISAARLLINNKLESGKILPADFEAILNKVGGYFVPSLKSSNKIFADGSF